MGNGINMILGTPGGRQFRIGSSESAVARGPYPGLTVLYFSSAQGMKGGSCELKVIVFWRSIQTPDKSLGENPAFVFGIPLVGEVCEKKGSAKTETAIKARMA
jgi:hypothetical protein